MNPPPQQSMALEQGHNYRWDRILFAATVLFLVLGLIAWGVTLLIKDDREFGVPVAAGEQGLEDMQAILQDSMEAETTSIAEAGSSQITSEPSAPEWPARDSVSQPKTGPDTTTADPAGMTTAAELASTPDDIRDQVHSSKVHSSKVHNNEVHNNEAHNNSGVKPDDRAGDSPTTPASSTTASNSAPVKTPVNSGGLFSGLTTKVPSQHVKRFTIARTVRDKEPVGSIADIKLSRDDVATLYAYSEVVDLKDETLRYVWSLNGNKIAEIKVPVWSQRWRSHSSKYATTSMRGQWRVELLNSNNQLLASSEFQY